MAIAKCRIHIKEAVKEILNDDSLKADLSKIAEEVRSKLQEVASRTLDKLNEMDPSIAGSLNPVIPSAEALKWADVFKAVSITGDEEIPINKRGSGVKRLVLLSFFRAEAERRLSEKGNGGVIYAIEEPETSQHTENQKKLTEALKLLSQMENVQVILTTHSAFIVKNLDFSNLRLIDRRNGNDHRIVTDVLPSQLKYSSLNEVNFIAFDEVAEQYHNELYGYIEFKGWNEEYKKGQSLFQYIQIGRDGNNINRQITLSEYIRHQIHHPENKNNPQYTDEQLRFSINEMREFIGKKQREKNVDPE